MLEVFHCTCLSEVMLTPCKSGVKLGGVSGACI